MSFVKGQRRSPDGDKNTDKTAISIFRSHLNKRSRSTRRTPDLRSLKTECRSPYHLVIPMPTSNTLVCNLFIIPTLLGQPAYVYKHHVNTKRKTKNTEVVLGIFVVVRISGTQGSAGKRGGAVSRALHQNMPCPTVVSHYRTNEHFCVCANTLCLPYAGCTAAAQTVFR